MMKVYLPIDVDMYVLPSKDIILGDDLQRLVAYKVCKGPFPSVGYVDLVPKMKHVIFSASVGQWNIRNKTLLIVLQKSIFMENNE